MKMKMYLTVNESGAKIITREEVLAFAGTPNNEGGKTTSEIRALRFLENGVHGDFVVICENFVLCQEPNLYNDF